MSESCEHIGMPFVSCHTDMSESCEHIGMPFVSCHTDMSESCEHIGMRHVTRLQVDRQLKGCLSKVHTLHILGIQSRYHTIHAPIPSTRPFDYPRAHTCPPPYTKSIPYSVHQGRNSVFVRG